MKQLETLIIQDLDGTLTYTDVGREVTYKRVLEYEKDDLLEQFNIDMHTAKKLGNTPDGGQLVYFLAEMAHPKYGIESLFGLGKEYHNYSREGVRKVHDLWTKNNLNSVIATAGPESPALEYAEIIGINSNGCLPAFGSTFEVDKGKIVGVGEYCGADAKVKRMAPLVNNYKKVVMIGDSGTNDGPLMDKIYELNGENALNIAIGKRAEEQAHFVIQGKDGNTDSISYFLPGLLSLLFGNSNGKSNHELINEFEKSTGKSLDNLFENEVLIKGKRESEISSNIYNLVEGYNGRSNRYR